MTDLIYCARKNRFAPLAVAAGMLYGSQLPNPVWQRPYFADQDDRSPDRVAYMASLAAFRPALATVLDVSSVDQLDEVLSWAVEAAQFVSEAIVIIPKCDGVVDLLPRFVGGVEVRLGYSVPTSRGSTSLAPSVFNG